MGFQVTASTLGNVTPGNQSLWVPYRWRGIPGWKPGDARYRDSLTAAEAAASERGRENAAGITEGKAGRLREFAARRAAGLGVTAAGHAVGIGPKTARSYEKQRLADLEAAS